MAATANNETDGLVTCERADDADDTSRKKSATGFFASDGTTGTFVDDNSTSSVKTVSDPPFSASLS